MAENPFRIGTHVSGPFFTDRAAEVKRVRRALVEPSRLLVHGPRRMGKSSLIGVAVEAAARKGARVVRADLSTASGLVDVANRLLASLSAARPRDRLAEFASRFVPSVTLTFEPATGAPRLELGAGLRNASPDRQRRSLDEVLLGLHREAEEGDGPVAVVLDEFQAIRRFGGEEAEWHLRDLVQRCGALSFVCAGSEESLIREMLGQERAFFRMFELLHVGPVDPEHLARWLDSRMESAGVRPSASGVGIVEAAGPRTQDILQVARHVFARGLGRGQVEEGDVAEAIDQVVREEDPVIRALWSNLTAHQQNVLRAVASGVDQLFSVPVRERFGLPTSSTVAAAVTALEGRGILVREEDGRIAFDSPFVRSWVGREALPDVPRAP